MYFQKIFLSLKVLNFNTCIIDWRQQVTDTTTRKQTVLYSRVALLVLRSLNHSVEKTNCMRCRFTIKPLCCDIKKSILWYHKIELVISQNRICDITKSSWLCDVKKSILWHHKLDFVISKNQKLWYHKIWSILNRWNDDSHKKKASAGVFPPTEMADRTCRLETAIVCVHLVRMRFICGSYHFSKDLKCKNYFVISQNRLFDITKS